MTSRRPFRNLAPLAFLTLLCSVHAHAMGTAGNAQAGATKAAACGACHGPQGVSAVPTFPSLAGLSATYLETQLRDYKAGNRKDPMMTAQAATLSDQDISNVSAYYASLTPKPVGHPDATSRGGQLYVNGDPAKGVPACQGCHGPAGEGPQPHAGGAAQPVWAGYPRIAGQPEGYIEKVLGEYKQGSRTNNTNAKVMGGVMQNIDDSDVKALAAYIATQ